jgi:glycosyltransferase involved in cell wall biosynthesis
VIIGDGEQRPALEATAARLGLDRLLRMPGWLDDPAAVLAASDVFVLTSLWEGLPRALVEAIALGVPAICYRADGVADLLSGEDEARPRGDVEGLSRAVARVLKDRSAAARLAASQAGRVTRDYDIVEMVRQQEMLYLDLARRSLP